MLGEPKVLKSELDPSVNFVWEFGKGRAIEARYVRRHENYVACYLSSQTACAQSCRMCHLTITGQNEPENVIPADFIRQAQVVLEHYKTQPPAKVIHYNFMARGEPLDSLTFRYDADRILSDLGTLALGQNLYPRFLVSTIIPEDLGMSFIEMFRLIQPEIYYSLYSMDPKFRRRWLPRAMEPMKALKMLADWQRHSKKIVRIHHALIKGENDAGGDAANILDAVREVGLRCDFTLVRYNPPSKQLSGEESNNYEVYANVLEHGNGGQHRVKVINRVGFDVAASCGMFINAQGE